MSIDLEKNKAHILQVHNDVLDDKTSTDWALFGYEGQTNVLKVIGFGDEGLDELVDELNASKIIYGVIRIQDPKTSRMKCIFLNWQGEGAPNLRKGVCARHLQDVKRFLKGVHITFTARTEEDLDAENILNAVAKATSTEYNFKERSELPERNVPVGTNYKRTNPQTEIDANRRNKFWEEQEAEEKVRKEEEIKKREEEAKRLEKERMERELRESKHREEINKERNARILAEKKAEMAAMARKKEEVVDSQGREEEEVERARRADVMRMERKKEAESLIGHKTLQTRSIFESQTNTQSSNRVETKQSLSRPPPRKLKEFNPAAVATELSSSTHKENVAPRKSVVSRWPPPTEESVLEQRSKVPGKITEWKPHDLEPKPPQEPQINSFQNEAPPICPPSAYQDRLSPTPRSPPLGSVANSQPSEIISPPTSSIPSPAEPASPLAPPPPATTHISENGAAGVGEKKSEVVVPGGQFSPNGFTRYPSPKGDEVEEEAVPRTNGGDTSPHYYARTGEGEEEEDYSAVCMTYEVDGIEYQILPEHGLCARALYDYQAADDTEITFDPGDIITNIDQIDVGWWQGVSPMGVFGLFPANYVELINGTKIH